MDDRRLPISVMTADSNLLRYGFAVALVALATILRLLLNPLWGPTAVPFIFYFATVALAGWYGRIGPALLAMALSALAADYFFMGHGLGFEIADATDGAALVGFMVGSLAIVACIQAMHTALAERIQAERSVEEAGARQESLYRLVDNLHRAESESEVYDAALDCISTALRCDRAAILLFDDSPVMRFVDARGLSERCRKAVEGHSPWGPDARHAQPICIQDAEVGELNASIGEAMKAEGVRALCFVPLFAGRKLIGKFMAYYDRPHSWSKADTDFAVSIARQLAFGISKQRLGQELRQRVSDLAAADRQKDDFLAMLGHELRNPLAAMQSALYLIKSTPRDSSASVKALPVMERQLQHLVHLVDDLLDVSRILRGMIELRTERVDLAAVIRAATEIAQPVISTRRHILETSLPAQPAYVRGDPTRLAQVVSNLLTNAAKYSPEASRIMIGLKAQAGRATIVVKDYGEGIAPELLPHVFDVFVQGNQNLARSKGGLGIGLTLVRKLVEMHGGEVTAYSGGKGQGSEFIIHLPLVDEMATASPSLPATPEPAPTSGSYRILLVDDNVDAANALGTILQLHRHHVQCIYDGRFVLAEAERFGPDVIVLDIGLPHLDGYMVARQLRAHPAFARTPLFAVTGYGQREDRVRARQAGFDQHLTKPVDAHHLLELICRRASQTQKRNADAEPADVDYRDY